MSLNIKNEGTHDLVRRLALLTGQSQTGAVDDAVRRRLAELEGGVEREHAQRKARIDLIVAEVAALEVVGPTHDEIMAEMYDEQGLPR